MLAHSISKVLHSNVIHNIWS